MLNLNESFKALSLSLSAEPEILNSSKYNFNANEKGRSMIEMLGVLAIIGVLSVGGIAGYSKAMLKYKTNKTIDQITMLTTNIRTLYAQQKDFEGLNAAVHNTTSGKDTLGVVPDELQGSAANLVNPFSGSIVVTEANSVDGAAGTNRAFIIEINGIPKEACMAIATSDWGSNYSSGLIGMAVGSTSTTAHSSSSALDYIFSPAYAAETTIKTLQTAGSALATVYAGCPTGSTGATASIGALTAVNSTKASAICAKNMPIDVANASTACSCTGSECSVAFKYY
jgi:type II secretory pathway pseudopilin PulG